MTIQHKIITTAAMLLSFSASIAYADNYQRSMNYPVVLIDAVEFSGNQTRRMKNVKYIITADNPRADNHVRLPLQKTPQQAGAKFMVPPSSIVGEYTITAQTQHCGSQSKKTTLIKGQRKFNFRFTNCRQYQSGNNNSNNRSSNNARLSISLNVPEYFSKMKIKVSKDGRKVGERTANRTSKASFSGLKQGETYQVELYTASANGRTPPVKTFEHTVEGSSDNFTASISDCN